jgi:hypothetical protein
VCVRVRVRAHRHIRPTEYTIMTVSPAKLAANRANAKKSTGPRTAAGKHRCSLNAIRHGAFSQRLVLPSEDSALFHRFRASIIDDIRPRRSHERQLCEQIVDASWRLLRLQRSARTATDIDTLDRLSRSEQRLQRSIDRSLAEFVKLRGRKPNALAAAVAATIARAE